MRESVSQTRKLSQVGQSSAPCCRGRNPPAARAASEPSLSVGLSVRLSPPAPHSLPHGSNTERAVLKLWVNVHRSSRPIKGRPGVKTPANAC